MLGIGGSSEEAVDTANLVAAMAEFYHLAKFAQRPELLPAAASEAWRKVDPARGHEIAVEEETR